MIVGFKQLVQDKYPLYVGLFGTDFQIIVAGSKPAAFITLEQPWLIEIFGPAVGRGTETILKSEVISAGLQKVKICGPAPDKQTKDPTFMAVDPHPIL